MLGTTPRTLRQWESTGELIPSRKTKGWHKTRCCTHPTHLPTLGRPTGPRENLAFSNLHHGRLQHCQQPSSQFSHLFCPMMDRAVGPQCGNAKPTLTPGTSSAGPSRGALF